jgi:hypothetical protein
MALPIITELNKALAAMCAAGCGVALNNENLSRYIPPARTLGEKAPVFTKLADLLTILVAEDSPEALIKTVTLAVALEATQLDATPRGQTREIDYAAQPYTPTKLTYQDIRKILEGNPMEDKPGAAAEVKRSLPELLKQRYWSDYIAELAKWYTVKDGILKKFKGKWKFASIPEGVTRIGEKAFDGCTGLTNLTLPDSITSIGDNAFEGCTGLTSITLPDSITSIEYRAFEGCTSTAIFK